MKIKCIDNYGLEKSLTIGKIYEVIKEDGVCYKIIDDSGYKCWYVTFRFNPLSVIRNNIINKLLDL